MHVQCIVHGWWIMVPLKIGLCNNGLCQSHRQSQMTRICVEQSRMHGVTLLMTFTSPILDHSQYYGQTLGGYWEENLEHKIKKKEQLSDLPPLQSYSAPNFCVHVYWLYLCGAAFMSQDRAHTAFAYGSHYFWWQSRDNSKLS